MSTQPSQKLVDRAGLPPAHYMRQTKLNYFSNHLSLFCCRTFQHYLSSCCSCCSLCCSLRATCSMSDEGTATLLEQEELSNPVPIILGVVGTIVVLFFAGTGGVVWVVVEGPA